MSWRSTSGGRSQRGQAMVEYSAIAWLLILALVLGVSVRIFPGAGGDHSVAELFLEAFRVSEGSVYSLLNGPFP